jgi:hypothetical protein
LRLKAIEGIETPTVLDAFSANGDLWNAIRSISDKTFRVVRIEKNKGMKGFYLQGDNLKWMAGMDLNKFNVIDLDAFGNCYHQLQEMKRQKYSGVVICTWITSVMSPTNSEVMNEIGITDDILKACPSICAELSREAIFSYIKNVIGVYEIYEVIQEEKNKKKQGFERLYFSFQMTTL